MNLFITIGYLLSFVYAHLRVESNTRLHDKVMGSVSPGRQIVIEPGPPGSWERAISADGSRNGILRWSALQTSASQSELQHMDAERQTHTERRSDDMDDKSSIANVGKTKFVDLHEPRIPRTLFLTSQYPTVDLMKDPEKSNVKRIKELNYDLQSIFFGNDACHEYLELKRGRKDLSNIFDMYLKRGIGKVASDVCRAAYLYYEGGFYLDNDVELTVPLSRLVNSDTAFMAAWESNPTGVNVALDYLGSGQGVLNAIIGTEPRSKILENTIQQILSKHGVSAIPISFIAPGRISLDDSLKTNESTEKHEEVIREIRRNVEASSSACKAALRNQFRGEDGGKNESVAVVLGGRGVGEKVEGNGTAFKVNRTARSLELACSDWLGPTTLFEGLKKFVLDCHEQIDIRFSSKVACTKELRMFFEVPFSEKDVHRDINSTLDRSIRENVQQRRSIGTGNLPYFALVDMTGQQRLIGWPRCPDCRFGR